MKSKEIAFVAVTVFFRTASVVSTIYGVFMVMTPLLMTGFDLPPMIWRILLVYCLSAAVLWFLAKPIASLVVIGIESEKA